MIPLRAHSGEEDSSLCSTKGDDIRCKQDDLVRTEIGYDVSQHLHCERDGPRERADVLVVRQKATIELFVFESEIYPVEETDGPGDWVQLAGSCDTQASSIPYRPLVRIGVALTIRPKPQILPRLMLSAGVV